MWSFLSCPGIGISLLGSALWSFEGIFAAEWTVSGYSCLLFLLTGWIWQAPATVLYQHRHLFALLQCCEPFVVPECEWKVGSWDPTPLPQSTDYSRWDTVGPPGGRQSPHWARQMQRKACGRGGRKALCRGNKSLLLHWVLCFDSEKPQRSLWCSHCCWHSILWYSTTAKKIEKQNSGQNEKPLQVLVEKVLLFCIVSVQKENNSWILRVVRSYISSESPCSRVPPMMFHMCMCWWCLLSPTRRRRWWKNLK